MTTSDEHNPPSRPISVAELLAKNGSIGSPPVGGRRRRRRGDTDSISVAELTGEIPIVTDDRRAEDTGTLPKVNGSAHSPSAAPTVAREATRARPVEREPLPHAFEPQPQRRAAETARAPLAFDPRPASRTAPPAREVAPRGPQLDDGHDSDDIDDLDDNVFDGGSESDVYPVTYPDDDYDESRTGYTTDGAEQMSFDPVVDEADPDLDDVVPADLGDLDDLDDDANDEPVDVSRYLRSGQDTLFGGESFADDVARGRPRDSDFFAKGPSDPKLETEADHDDNSDLHQESRGSTLLHGALIVGQSILAVAFGAGMFLGFDQLWQWNPIVALVLSVLVILGLVVGVRVVRKTEDIASTLIAVAVGLLVCLGPLALLR